MMIDEDKEYEKKQKAMKKRLVALGKENPVVQKAIERQEPHDSMEAFEIVHELVSAAMSEYEEKGGSPAQCMKNLGKAIVVASAKMKNKNGDVDENEY